MRNGDIMGIYSKFRAFASAVPETAVTNDDLSKLVNTNDEWITSRTGIKRRHIAYSEEENNIALCTETARKLLLKTGIPPEEIGLIIIASISQEYRTPATACIVQNNIGAVNSIAFDISAACAGFVYACSIADKFIKSGQVKRAVVIGCEVLSKLMDWTDRSTCVLFGDGASGAILEASDTPGILSEDIKTDGSRWQAITGGYSPLLPVMSPESASVGKVAMNGREVFDFVIGEVPKSMERALTSASLGLDDVDWIIPHQVNARLVEALAKKLRLPMERFYMNMQEYGNTSAASIGIALAEMEDKGLICYGSGKHYLITGFGAGLVWGSMAFRF